jgi:putative transposase
MSRLVPLFVAQMKRLFPHFPRSRGLARVDDRRIVSGIVSVIRNGLQWKDAPPGYGPHKTLYNRVIRWSRLGVFDRIFATLVGEAGVPERLVIDSTHLKAHRTAAACSKRGIDACVDLDASGGPKAA